MIQRGVLVSTKFVLSRWAHYSRGVVLLINRIENKNSWWFVRAPFKGSFVRGYHEGRKCVMPNLRWYFYDECKYTLMNK